MIGITERAARGLEAFLGFHEATPEQAVKLFPRCEGGIGMTIAKPRPEDELILSEGRPLLAVDPHVAQLLSGSFIDCDSVEIHGRLGIRFQIRSLCPKVLVEPHGG